ncbi:MAG: putative metal-dependent hydrolase [Candidatus Latescibacteria bacterium]|nr:putative metal-dependent hydrolase [Candidatus Latescibacterota bacterium]
MITPAERRDCIARIQQLPALVEEAVKGLHDDQLNTPYRQGGWTVRQVVHHLADSHLNAFVRMKLILTEDRPTLKPYDQDAWAKLPDAAMPVASSVSILKGLHDRWTVVLEHVPESGWTRSAFHPEIGEVTLERMLVTYAGHGEHHVGQITGLRAAKGW